MLERHGCFHIVNSRRVRRKLQLGQDRIDRVLFSLQQVSQKDLVLNKLRSFACQIGATAGKQLLKTIPSLRPILLEKWDFRKVEARIPKLGIDPGRFEQCCFPFVVVTLPHQDNAAQIFRRGEIGLAGIDRVEFL